MAKEPPQTVGDLRRKAVVSDAEISAATDAFLDDPKIRAFQFSSGHKLDVVATIEAHRPAKAALTEMTMPVALRRLMVRTTAILATPTTE